MEEPVIGDISKHAFWSFGFIMPALGFVAGIVSVVGFSDYLQSKKKSSWWAVAASPVLLLGEMLIGLMLGAILLAIFGKQ